MLYSRMESDKEQSDQESMDGEEWKELHQAIQNGDIEYVKRLLQNEAADQHFSYQRTSALHRAFSCEQYEIASYLIHRGAKAHDSELCEMYRLDIDLSRLNHLLLQYNRKTEKSCIFQLISWSQSPQGLEGDRLLAVISLYEEFYESPILKLIMMVLEKEVFDIVFDFESQDVNRTHRLYEEEAEIYGVTLSNEREIFLGAKDLLSGDSRKRAKVCGVVAEEFCHLALTILFENNANPYRKEDSELRREFRDIVSAVKCSLHGSCHLESVIKDVYRNYECHEWECELIARVPHVIGIYGEEKGRIIMESRELSRLFAFYMDNIHPKCKEYTDPLINTKSHRLMKHVLNRSDCISFQEKVKPPLIESFPSFRDSLVEFEGVSVITTNSEKICTLHIYHELKREYGDKVEMNCLFLTKKRFEEETKRILHALRGRAWKYLILVLDEEDLNPRRLTCKYLDEFEEFKGDEMKIVVISASQSLGPEFERKMLSYKWNDLTDDFKSLQQYIRYIFKGEEDSVYIAKEYFPELFSEEEILRIVSGSVFKVCDGEGLYSLSYSPETYIDREFQIMTLDKEFFKHLPHDTSVFLCGLSEIDFKELQMDNKLVQWFSGSDDGIHEGKSIFINNIQNPMTFKDFERKNPRKINIWVQHDEKVFYVRYSDLYEHVLEQFGKQIAVSEKEVLSLLERKKIVIISDNAGYGKSTVISSLIRGTKENVHRSWLWRIDFNQLSLGMGDPLSLANINPDSSEKEVLNYLFILLGLNTGLEKYLFKPFSRYGKCYLFFDGFDEIPSKYLDSALKLLSFVGGKTNAKTMVTTRKHHEKKLEEFLNRISHQLAPFSEEDQVTFLDKFWKNKLRPPKGEGKAEFQKYQKAVAKKIIKIIEGQKGGKTESDPVFENIEHALEKIESSHNVESAKMAIESLDFTELAESILDKTLRNDGNVEFMGIPLHLNMIANIYYNGNFNIELESDIYHLYQQFIEQKILIYIEDKEGVLKEGKLKDRIVKSNTENAYRIHMELALQSIEQEKLCLDEDDREFCSALGIVFIHNERLNFIHKTFAEFFLAEFMRIKAEKRKLLKLFYDFDYVIVRRFLSSCLREKNFENMSKEFFEDSNFLANVMYLTFHNFSYYVVYESNSDILCSCKIVKKLLQNFEVADVTKELVHEFIDRLHRIMMEESEGIHFWNGIGGCLTGYMLKCLLTRDFVFYSKSITMFVRVSENVEEVLDVLNECISINIDFLWYLRCLFDKEFVKNVENYAVTDSLLDMLAHKVLRNDIFFLHALSNERSEVFAHILKLFKDVLGRERFISEIVESTEYWKQVMLYLSNVSLSRFCSTLEALHSIFGNELENLFMEDIKFWTIFRATEMDGSNGSTKSFQRVISSFRKCFGIEKLKDFLLSCNFSGNYLINTAMFSFSSPIFMKYLHVVEKNLDSEEMKQFLRSRKITYTKNIFHLAVGRNLCLGDLLEFYDRYEVGEIQDMLSDSDEYGDNLIHMIFGFNSSDKMEMNLAVIRKYLSDDRRFIGLLKRGNWNYCNFYHFAAVNENELDLTFLTDYLSPSEITELLLERDAVRATFLHHAACYNVKNLPFFLEYAHRMLKTDQSRLKEIVVTKTKHGNTFLHTLDSLSSHILFLDVPDLVKKIFDTLRKILPGKIFRRFLKLKNKNGQTFLQTEKRDELEIRTVFKEVLEADLFEELLEKESNHSNVYISALLYGIVIACSIYDKFMNSRAHFDA